MALFDLSHAELQRYRPERHEMGDFDDFWASTLAETRSRPLDLAIEPVDYGLKIIDTYDVTFSGYGGQRIKGWLNLPRDRANGKLPCVVEYIGYGGGRGYPLNWLIWASAGYAHLIMDTRGQGSVWQQAIRPIWPTRAPARRRPFHDAGHPEPQDLLLSTRVLRRCGGPLRRPSRSRTSTRRASPSPAPARAAASRWPWPGCSATPWSRLCPRCRSCVAIAAPQRSATPIHTPRSRSICVATAIRYSRRSTRCPT